MKKTKIDNLKFYLIQILLLILSFNTNLFCYIKDLSVDAKNIVLNNVSCPAETNGDGNTSILNPALFDKNYKFTASYIPLEYNENISHIFFNVPVDDYYFQFNYSNFNSENVEIWNDNNVFLKNENYKQKLVAFSGAKTFQIKNKKVDAGVRLNSDSASLGDTSIYSKVYFDLGANTVFNVLNDNLGVGFSLLNIGDNEQTKVAVGVSKKLLLDWYLSMVKPLKSNLEYSLSGEYKVAKNLKVFAGVDNNMFDSNMDFMSGIRLGTSFNFKNFDIDYAFAKRGELGFINYFTFNYVYEFNQKDEKGRGKGNIQENRVLESKIEGQNGTENIFVEQEDFKKYKIGIFIKNENYEYIRDMILKYLEYDENLEIVEPALVDVLSRKENYFKEDVNINMDLKILEEAKNDLDLHIIGILSIRGKSDEFVVNIEYFDAYTKKIFYKNERKVYNTSNLEYQIRNMVYEFLGVNKKFIKKGPLEKEIERQEKLDKLIVKKKLLELKRKLKFEKQKKLKDDIKIRILNLKKELKLKKRKDFEAKRNDRILIFKIMSEKKDFKIKRIKIFEDARQARINKKNLDNMENQNSENLKNIEKNEVSL